MQVDEVVRVLRFEQLINFYTSKNTMCVRCKYYSFLHDYLELETAKISIFEDAHNMNVYVSPISVQQAKLVYSKLPEIDLVRHISLRIMPVTKGYELLAVALEILRIQKVCINTVVFFIDYESRCIFY